MNLWNYDLIQTFNENYYKDVLMNQHINDTEKFVEKAKDEHGNPIEINSRFYPLKKGMKNYLLPREYLNELPVLPDGLMVVSINREVYYLLRDRIPWGLRPEKKFETNNIFLKQFCDYEHINKTDFEIYKMIMLAGYFKRINVRISSEPSFGKDSVANVLKLLCGDVGVVHNPTMPKIEWLLTNKILVTNEVAGIKSTDKDNLQQYYLMCGDFNNVYEKRAVATYKGSQNSYNINQLSNVVYYNNIDCYPDRKKEKYFDMMFQRAVLERFIPFKFEGTLTEQFQEVLNKEKLVEDNIEFFKNNIKHLRYLEENFDNELHNYERKIDTGFKDRYLRNWNTLLDCIDIFSDNQEQFDIYCDRLYESYKSYQNMINSYKDKVNIDVEPFKRYEEELVE